MVGCWKRSGGTQDRRIQASHQNGIHCTLRRSSFSSQRCRWNSWFAFAAASSGSSCLKPFEIEVPASFNQCSVAPHVLRSSLGSNASRERGCSRMFSSVQDCAALRVADQSVRLCESLCCRQFGKFMHEAFSGACCC